MQVCQAELLVLVLCKAQELGMQHEITCFYNLKKIVICYYYLLNQGEDFQPHSPKTRWASTKQGKHMFSQCMRARMQKE